MDDTLVVSSVSLVRDTDVQPASVEETDHQAVCVLVLIGDMAVDVPPCVGRVVMRSLVLWEFEGCYRVSSTILGDILSRSQAQSANF